MRAAALLLALLLAFPAAATRADPTSSWRQARLITTSSAHPDKAFEAFDTASLMLADVDSDGRQEIVTQNDNNRAYVVDGANGRIRAELSTNHPGSWDARDLNPISIGPLEGPGSSCLVIPNSAAYISAFCYRGSNLIGDGLRFERIWEIDADPSKHVKNYFATRPWLTAGERPGLDGNAFLADVDGERRPEIFTETDGWPGQMSFASDGSFRWDTAYWDGNAGAVVADLDHDGKKEAVFVSDAGIVSCYDAARGTLRWTFDAQKHGVSPGSMPVAPLVADLDGDGKRGIITAAREAVQTSDAGWIQQSHATWFALRSDGRLMWATSEPWMNPLSYNHPAAVDVNGDGTPDVVGLDWNTIGHKPGNWETTGRPSNLFALDGRTGKPLWRASVQEDWSNKDFVIADFGSGPVIVLDERRDGADGLGVHSLRDGSPLGFFAGPPGWSLMRGPVAGDVDGDGRLELVVPLARPDPTPNYRNLDVGHREGALLVVSTGTVAKVIFSANFMQSDAAWRPSHALGFGERLVPAPLPFVAVALAAIWMRRRGRRV